MAKVYYKYLGEDDWNRKLFNVSCANFQSDHILVDVDGVLHTRTDEPWCEPCCPTKYKTPDDEEGEFDYANP